MPRCVTSLSTEAIVKRRVDMRTDDIELRNWHIERGPRAHIAPSLVRHKTLKPQLEVINDHEETPDLSKHKSLSDLRAPRYRKRMRGRESGAKLTFLNID
jgi:hypothetical protein